MHIVHVIKIGLITSDVVFSLCNFFGRALSMQCSGQEYDQLVSQVVTKLWTYVSTNTDVEVISAALKYVSTLSLYKYFFHHVYSITMI
jgi:hypothetical protein